MSAVPEQEEPVAGELVTAPATAIEPAKPVGQVAAQAAAVAATTSAATGSSSCSGSAVIYEALPSSRSPVPTMSPSFVNCMWSR